jgi:hypothetical protein
MEKNQEEQRKKNEKKQIEMEMKEEQRIKNIEYKKAK